MTQRYASRQSPVPCDSTSPYLLICTAHGIHHLTLARRPACRCVAWRAHARWAEPTCARPHSPRGWDPWQAYAPLAGLCNCRRQRPPNTLLTYETTASKAYLHPRQLTRMHETHTDGCKISLRCNHCQPINRMTCKLVCAVERIQTETFINSLRFKT